MLGFFKRKKSELIKSSVFFDEKFYREENALSDKTDAISHFLEFSSDTDPSPYFNRKFYLQKYPDVDQSKYNALEHYLKFGWREGRIPSQKFDRDAFLRSHPHINPNKVDPAACCLILYGGYRWNGSIALGDTEKRVSISIQDDFVTTVSDLDDHLYHACRNVFDESYYLTMYPDVAESNIDPFEHYMNFGFKENRNPSATFDTFYYKIKNINSSDRTNPLVHYVKHRDHTKVSVSSPDSTVIDPSDATNDSDKLNRMSVCVHVHCYYLDNIGEICKGIDNFDVNTRVIFTVCTVADREFVKNYLNKFISKFRYDVILVPNRGRDIAPFLVYTFDIWRNYDLVLHIHTKNSTHTSWGNAWRRYLFDQIMGSRAIVEKAVDLFAGDDNIGALYPENFYEIKRFIITNPNADNVKSTLDYLEIDDSGNKSIEFAAGSMCWYRTEAISGIARKFSDINLFEPEAGQLDNTLAHSLERAIPIFVRAKGLRVVSYTTPVRVPLGAPFPSPGRDVPSTRVATSWPRDVARAAVKPALKLAPQFKTFNKKALNIHWIIPSFGQGAGGHMTIFRMVHYLDKFGHNQTIWIQNAFNMPDEASAKQRIKDWYLPFGDKVSVLFLPDDMRQLSGDVLIATDCWTVFPATQATDFKERFYFVQDFEPNFHPVGTNSLIADETYNFGFSALCAGPWLDDLMSGRNIWSRSWDLAADAGIYNTEFQKFSKDKNDINTIAFYARPYTSRRAVELGFAAFELLHKRGFNFKVILFGEENIKVDYDFPFEHRGILSHLDLAELYKSADLGVVFSATNYSLIPLEMMACGLPVVELDVPSTRRIFSESEVQFAKPVPYAIADAIYEVLTDSERRALLRENGIKLATSTSWEESARKVETALVERLDELSFVDVSNHKALSRPRIISKPKVSVFIPTYNAGPNFEKIVQSIVSQKCDFKFDVLVIDSGSSDETLHTVEKFKPMNVRSEHIAKSDFQHGRTRNLGIEMTEGDYVAILTQDALPANENWLAALVNGFQHDKRVAGVFGRHVAYPEHGPFVERDIAEHFANLGFLPRVIDNDVGIPSLYYKGSTTWRMLMYFYSDNNSAISREVWKILPYPEIEWGEDYVWSENMIRSGFRKYYAADSVVYHSHDSDRSDCLKTAVAEGKFWAEHFGIRLYDVEHEAISQLNERDRNFARAKGLNMEQLFDRFKFNETLVKGRLQGWRQGNLNRYP